MKVLPEEILGGVVGRNFYASEIFDSYDINYCCEGGLSIAEACENRNIDVADIIRALEELPDQEDEVSTAFCDWPIDLLVAYIEKKHHRYVDHNLPELKDLLEKLITLHGQEKPGFKQLRGQLDQFEADLITHIEREEQFFPYIKQLVLLSLQPGENRNFMFIDSLRNCIENSLKEHEEEGASFDKINEQMTRLLHSENMDEPGHLLLKCAREFEEDLHRHIHLENNILFPKAVEMQSRLIKNYNNH